MTREWPDGFSVHEVSSQPAGRKIRQLIRTHKPELMEDVRLPQIGQHSSV